MPGRRNPPAKWVLPDVIDPPDHICITIPVPNNRYHIAAFWGALYNLTSARFWQDDLPHTALLVAKVWQDIYDSLKWGACDFNVPDLIAEMEYEMSVCEQLRYQDGKLQGLCCGEWTDITGQGDMSLGGPGQPGSGARQPLPGGGQECYHSDVTSQMQWNLPTVVNAGDVIEVKNAQGQATDAPNHVWYCPNGQLFFAGKCVSVPFTQGGDPAAAANHMTIVCQIAGVWYATDTPITVPGGVVNAPVVFQINDGVLSDNSGGYAYDVCVTNNAAADWCQEWDFALDPGDFVLNTSNITSGTPGVWTAGTGWQCQDADQGASPEWFRTVRLQLTGLAAFIVETAEITFDLTKGGFVGGGEFGILVRTLHGGGSTDLISINNPALVNGSNQTQLGALEGTAETGVQVTLTCSTSTPGNTLSGAGIIRKLKLCGKGPNPFAA